MKGEIMGRLIARYVRYALSTLACVGFGGIEGVN
jgi:hypothetical protein